MNQPTPKQLASFDQAKAMYTEEWTRLVNTYRTLLSEKKLSSEQAASFLRSLVKDPDGPFQPYNREAFAGLIAIAVLKLSEQESELAQWRSAAGMDKPDAPECKR